MLSSPSSAITLYLLLYGVLALSHLALQMALAHANHRRRTRTTSQGRHARLAGTPTVSVVVPTYNEDPRTTTAVIESILAQEEVDVEVIVVDDLSPNRAELIAEAYDRFVHHPRVKIVLPETHRGKRECQADAFQIARGEFTVTVDSDTILHDRRSIAILLADFADEKVGAVTGDVRVQNTDASWLSNLIGYRYWTAFNQERAAQSYFGIVMCASGPFSAWRTSALRKLLADYTSQHFLGAKCTYGDDRHLTNLFLDDGWDVRYNQHARAWTYVPTTLRAYLRQQVRWNKSFYREMLITARFMHRRHAYLGYELVMQATLPFLLLVALFLTAWQATAGGQPELAAWYVVTLVVIALVRALYGFARTGDRGFFAFVGYAFLHVGLLIPTRFYALARLRDTRWGTRTGAANPGGQALAA